MEKRNQDASADPPSYNDAIKQTATAPNNQRPSIGFQLPTHQQQPQIAYTPSTVQIRMLQQVGPTTTVIVTSDTSQNYGPLSQFVVCPSCGARVQTNVVEQYNTAAHLFAGILCVMGLFCCSCIPYLIDSCKNKMHYCPECNAYLGTYNYVPQSRGVYVDSRY